MKIPNTKNDVVITFFKMAGLTGSGLPLPTTLFNTLRNLAIAGFMCKLAGAVQLVIYQKKSNLFEFGDHAICAAGDDCDIIIDSRYYHKLQKVIANLSCTFEPKI